MIKIIASASHTMCFFIVIAKFLDRTMRHRRRLAEHPVDARPADPQPASDFAGCYALSLELDDLGSLPASSWHAALVAAVCLGFRNALPLAFQHRLPFSLTHGADDSEHEAASR